MQVKFLTEKQADEALKIATDTMASKYCPVILRSCRRDCMSYRPGDKHNRTGSTWVVSEPMCNHPFIGGTLFVEY